MTSTVLLTGISGYIGLHCAKQLLEAGFFVRGSVRSVEKSREVLDTLAACAVDTRNLSIVELDLTSDAGWSEAITGCDFLMHVASPFAIANPRTEEEMITPAVDGTLRAMRAALGAGVKRVVLTSSVVAMHGSMKVGKFTPETWTDVGSPYVNTYIKSKTLAERAAWDFVKTAGVGSPELVVINPGAVFGPPLGRDISGQSMTSVDQMLRGKIPMVPNIAFAMVDVRDVAQLHVQALTAPNVQGQRFIAAHAETFSFGEIAQQLKDAGYKGPSTRKAPDFMIKLLALFDREAQGMVPMLGMRAEPDTSATYLAFDWTPIPFSKTLKDSAEAVKALQA